MSRLLWGIDVARARFEARGLSEGEAPLSDLIDAFIRELELPRTLASVGVGRDLFDRIAENSLQDVFCKTNPAPLERKEQVLEILEMCA